MQRLARILALSGLFLVVSGSASADTCVLTEVKSADGAELTVYFTRFPKEDNTQGRYRKCRISEKSAPNARTFFVTPFRQDANTIVLRENWPRGP